MVINVQGKENTIKSIKAIGQNLIERAEEICIDLDNVKSITIYANLTSSEICNFDVTKNYIANFEEKEKE